MSTEWLTQSYQTQSPMHRDRINIEFIGTGQERVSLAWPLKDINYVEQLTYSILEANGVGPIYRQLFGIRLIRAPNIWLAPNIGTQTLLQSHLGTSPNTLELRMRFRPSSFTKLLVLDKRAFDICFAQIRYDFLHTKFSEKSKDLILLNNSVLGLIAADLVRHSLENDINTENIFKCVKLEKFIPLRASRWQRPLLFHLRNRLNLPKSIQIGVRSCDKNILKVKQAFIELFLHEVSPDYGTETHRVVCLEDRTNPIDMNIRIRYNQTPVDSYCVVETSLATQDSIREWSELCNIYSICYGSLRDDTIEIDRMNGKLLRLRFESSLEARSFLSSIDGYYRLMKKWNFNFCRDILSPDLEYLKSIKCHGPIGLESMRLKLTKLKKPGSFLIRRCMEKSNRFMVDALLQSKIRLTIDIDWNPTSRTFAMVGHSTNRDVSVEVYLNQVEYVDLKSLVDDVQIRVQGHSETSPAEQLKHWIPPSEHDDCPALLLSIPKSKIIEFDRKGNRNIKSFAELPRIFPPEMINFHGKINYRSSNKMIVRSACLNGEKNVVIKEHIDESQEGEFRNKRNNLVIYQDSKTPVGVNFFVKLKPAQLRLADWIFVKSPLFAETIGLDLTRNSLIQEYLPLGPLDRYLAKASKVRPKTIRSVVYQLASALLFLQERRIMHGKIRCHNALLSCLEPIQIKLTDPLGTFNMFEDLAFLSPEYAGGNAQKKIDDNGHFRLKEYDPGLDVWAFGTTLWQIHNRGKRPPPGTEAGSLLRPAKCPDDVWNVAESCWVTELSKRASAPVIFRDLNDAFAWKVEPQDYEYGPGDKETPRVESSFMNPDRPAAPGYYSNPYSALSNHSASANGSQMDLISSRTTSLSLESPNGQATDAFLIPKSVLKGTKKQSVMSWKAIFKPTKQSPKNSLVISNYTEYQNGSSVLSRRSASDCSTPSGSEDTKVTDVPDPNHMDGINENHSGTTIELSKLKLTSEIGRGSCGVVFKGVLSDWGGVGEQVVAIKSLNKQTNDLSQIEDLKREYEILKNLDHVNIVKTFGFVYGATMMLVMEFMPLGSLLTCIKSLDPDDLPTLPLHKYACDIARGMEYLESMKIVHRDLALRNILVRNDNEVKICDFGLAQFLDSANQYKLKTDRALPLKWYAPEVLSTWTFSHKTDVWSYGIVLWEIYSGGCTPQYSGSYENLLNTLKRERLLMPKGCPMSMYSLMLKCWSYNPEDRDNFSQVLDKLQANLNASDDETAANQAANK